MNIVMDLNAKPNSVGYQPWFRDSSDIGLYSITCVVRVVGSRTVRWLRDFYFNVVQSLENSVFVGHKVVTVQKPGKVPVGVTLEIEVETKLRLGNHSEEHVVSYLEGFQRENDEACV